MACPQPRNLGVSAVQIPAQQAAQPQHLQHRDAEQLGIERLLAGLVAERGAPGIGANRAAQHSEQQQSRLRNPPSTRLSLGLVDPERGKRGKVHRDQRGGEVGGVGEVGGGKQGMHGREVSGQVSPSGKGAAGRVAEDWPQAGTCHRVSPNNAAIRRKGDDVWGLSNV